MQVPQQPPPPPTPVFWVPQLVKRVKPSICATRMPMDQQEQKSSHELRNEMKRLRREETQNH